jgi:hypothetical protein
MTEGEWSFCSVRSDDHESMTMSSATDLRIDGETNLVQLGLVAEMLEKHGVALGGFCATAADGCTSMHLLVTDVAAARQALDEAGLSVTDQRDAIVLPDAGDMHRTLGQIGRRLRDSGVTVDAAYLAPGSRLVLAVDDVDAAWQAL